MNEFSQIKMKSFPLSMLPLLLPLITIILPCLVCGQDTTSNNVDQHPRFIEEPFDVKVKDGHRTVLPCKVAGLDRKIVDGGGGHVQWTRGGFGLGIGRATDWHNIRMIGQNLESKKC